MTEKNHKSGWRRVKFGDVVRQVKEKADPETSGLTRYVAGDHMETDDLRIRRWGEIGSGYLGPAFHIRFKPGQVLYGSRRTYLRKVAVADFEGICANTTFVLETKKPEELLPEFLPFLMQTNAFNEFSIKNSKGSVNPYINFSDLEEFEFTLPPIKTQESISKFLELIDFTNNSYDRSLIILRKVERSTIQNILGPEDKWSLSTMSSVVESIEAGKSPKASSVPAEPHELGVLKVSAVGYSGFYPKENKALLDPKEFLSSAVVKPGDFLVTRANAQSQGVARTCIVESAPLNLMLSDKTWRLNFKKNAPPKRFILAWSKLPKFRSYIDSLCSGTEAKNISQEKFLAAPMITLNKTQKQRLESILKKIDSSEEIIFKRYNEIKQIKNLVLEKILEA